jgi:hypothetical protein
MAVFAPGTSVESNEPIMEVTVSADRPLTPGQHRFRLIVVDKDGLSSAPTDVLVVVRDDRAPTAVLVAPSAVLFGRSFVLDGRNSSDPGGAPVAKFIWTMLE